MKASEISKDLNTIDHFQKEFQYYTDENLKKADKGELAAQVLEGNISNKNQSNLKKPELRQ